MGNNTTNASAPETQAQDQTQDASVIVLINVHFNMLPSLSKKHKIQKDSGQQSAFSNVVRNNLVYHSNTQLLQDPDDIKPKEITIPCQDLYFDEDFQCFDSQGEYMKIVEACHELEEFLKQKANEVSENSTVQVCINIIGYECIADVAWGLVSYLTLPSYDNIKDNSLIELITEHQIPFLNPFKEKGWSINVIGMNIVENGLIFQINKPYDKYLPNAYNGQQKTTASSSSQDSSQMSLLPDEDKMYSQAPQRTTPKRISLSAYKNASQAIISPMNLIKPSNGLDRNKRHLNDVQSYVNGNQNAAKKKMKKIERNDVELFSLEGVHTVLDIASFVPAVSTATSIANAGIYLAEAGYMFFFTDEEGAGEKVGQALISGVGAIPFSKLGAKAVKFFKGESKAGKAAEKAADARKQFESIVKDVDKILEKSQKRVADAYNKMRNTGKKIDDLMEEIAATTDYGKKNELRRMQEEALNEWYKLKELYKNEFDLLMGTINQRRVWKDHLGTALVQERNLRKEYEAILKGLEGVTRFEKRVKEMETILNTYKSGSLLFISKVYEHDSKVNEHNSDNDVAAKPVYEPTYDPAEIFQ